MSTWTFVAFAFGKGAQLVTLLLLAHILQPFDYGRLTLTQGLVAIFELFITLGAAPLLSKYIPAALQTSPRRCAQIINLCGATFCFACLSVVILTILFARDISQTLGSSEFFVLVTLAWALCLGANNLLIAILVALERGRSLGAVSGCGAIAALAIIPPLGVYHGVNGAIIGFAAVETCKLVFAMALYQRSLSALGGSWKEKPLLADLRLFLDFGLPVFLAAAIYSPSTWSAQLIVKANAPQGTAAVGVFGFTNNVFGAMMLLSTLTNQAALPIFSSLEARGDFIQLRRASAALSIFQLFAAAVIAAPLIALSKFIMTLAGPAFAPEWPVLIVMIIAGVVLAGQTSLGNHILVRKHGAYILLATLLPWCAVLIGTANQMAYRGAMGLALAMLFATAIRTSMVAGVWLLQGRSPLVTTSTP